jgi:tetratricopeptide (TPR) repeat protein
MNLPDVPYAPTKPISRRFAVALAMFVLSAGGLAGCDRAPTTTGNAGAREEHIYRDELFLSAIDSLARLDEFESGSAFQEIMARLQRGDESGAADAANDPLAATWPQPAMLRQIVDRLNLWTRTGAFAPGWQADPMVATLPEEFRQLPMMADLSELDFTRYDGFALLEAKWMREVSQWTRGDELDDLSRAQRMFDWTVRSIAIEPPRVGADGQLLSVVAQVPWEAIFYGRGTAWERAWVFMLMARQQGIEAAVLGIADADDASRPPRPWAVAVLSQGQAYLFDPALGLPIPAADGIQPGAPLRVRPATLASVVADPSRLRQLDIGESHVYPVTADDVKERLVVMLEASPAYLSRRSRLLEERLAGEQKLVLTTAPSVMAERWKALEHVGDVRLWTQPYQTLAQRLRLPHEAVVARLATLMPFYSDGHGTRLRRGRMLHLKGKLVGDGSATWWYQQARPANEDIAFELQKTRKELDTAIKEEMAKVPAAQRAAVEAERRERAEEWLQLNVGITQRVKQDASFWLGAIAFDRGTYDAAIDYFARRVLRVEEGGPWEHAARYQLARSLESLQKPSEAIDLYREDTQSPMYHGNLLRAGWLESSLGEASPSK